MVTADAGQFYEVTEHRLAIDVLRKIMKMSGIAYVSVKRGKRRVARVVDHAYQTLPGYVTFPVQRLTSAFIAGVTLNFCKLGSRALATTGIATGGMLSRIAAAVVLCWSEDRMLRNYSLLTKNKFKTKHLDLQQCMLALRYIDDLILISKCL